MVGVDTFFEKNLNTALLKGKNVGVITNHTAINADLKLTLDVLKRHARDYKIVAIFAPEHGFYGDLYADKDVQDSTIADIPVFSLHGERKRPTGELLKNIDVLIYDIQDIGSRSYTYISTLFYCMEEAAKQHIKCIVFDRPNPLGCVVDGPLMQEKWRSFLGYINIPYCHGMTVGELATLFNEEYNIGCDLVVIPMKGWKREMPFQETGLIWVPTSPQIPEADTAFFYPTTGLIGHLSLANIGIGYTLPFKIVGAPWVKGEVLAAKLNEQKLPGVAFHPFYFCPFFGKFKGQNCQGIKIIVTDSTCYLPFTTQYVMIGILKTLYPRHFKEAMEEFAKSSPKCALFHKLNGNEEIFHILKDDPYFIWKLRAQFQKDRETFQPIRKKYLNPIYST